MYIRCPFLMAQSKSRKELAAMYDTPYSTFNRWLSDPVLVQKLADTGITYRRKSSLPPKIVQTIIEHLGEPESERVQLHVKSNGTVRHPEDHST